MHRWLVPFLALLFTTATLSGCIQGPVDEDPGSSQDDVPPEPVRYESTATRTEQVQGLKVPTGDDESVATWTLDLPPDLVALNATLSWTQAQNEYRITIEDANGTTENFPASDDTKVEAVATKALGGGATTITTYARSQLLDDTLTLEVTYVWLAVPTATTDGLPTGDIRFEQRNGKWFAIQNLAVEKAVDDVVALDVKTFNGRIVTDGSDRDRGRVEVEAYASGSTKEAAEANLALVDVKLRLTNAEALAHVTKDASFPKDENVGAHIDLYLPATMTGSAQTTNGALTLTDATYESATFTTSNGGVTIQGSRVDDSKVTTTNGALDVTDSELIDSVLRSSNGGIDLDGVIGERLTLGTSNGAIQGALEAAGELEASTSNGRIALDVTPTSDLVLDLQTTNSGIDLALKEGTSIAYDLSAATTNGRISSSMDEAELDTNERGTSGTLRTPNGSGRHHQVTGDIESSNGGIAFESL